MKIVLLQAKSHVQNKSSHIVRYIIPHDSQIRYFTNDLRLICWELKIEFLTSTFSFQVFDIGSENYYGLQTLLTFALSWLVLK